MRDKRESLLDRNQRIGSENPELELTLTHLMRNWISDLGKLENALIKPGMPKTKQEQNNVDPAGESKKYDCLDITIEGDELRTSDLRVDLFGQLLAYARSLLPADVKFGGKSLDETERTFMLMELAILSTRLAVAAVNSGVVVADEQKDAVRHLFELAMDLEARNPPPFAETQEDPYRALLQHYYDLFKKEGRS